MIEIIKSQKELRAKKEHVCNFCRSRINIGELYLRATYKLDYLYDWKTHIQCSKIADKLNMYDECADEGLTSYEFVESINCKYEQLLHMQNKIDELNTFKDKLEYVIKYYEQNEFRK